MGLAESPMLKRLRLSWLSSEETELLEAEGATKRGIAIIDELNDVYSRTGATRPISNRVISAARELFEDGKSEIRIVEIGARDGSLLRQIETELAVGSIEAELHGVEFRDNITELAQRRASEAGSKVSFRSIQREGLGSIPQGYYDIVYSAFALHHRSRGDITLLLAQCCGLSRKYVFHLDLSRSLIGVIGIWLVYTVLGGKLSRRDAVLSCRRAFRMNEIRAVLEQAGLGLYTSVTYVVPFSWIMETDLTRGSKCRSG